MYNIAVLQISLSDFLGLPHTSAFFIRRAALRQGKSDIISIFTGVLFWMLGNWLAYSAI